MILANIIIIFLLIALNGFFTAVEFAAVSARRARLDLLAGSDGKAAAIVRSWLEQPSARERLIAATQLGITMASLALGAIGENTFQAWLDPYFQNAHLPAWISFLDSILPALPLVISLIVVTALHVVLGEQVPKVAVLRSPERFAITAAPIIQVFSVVFRAFISLLDWATRIVLRLVGLPAHTAHTNVYTLEELKEMVSGPEVEGVIEMPEREMISAIIDFGELVVRQVMVPRTEIIAIEAGTPLNDIVRLSLDNSITKLPVYEESLDRIIGIIHIRDILQAMVDHQGENRLARDLVRDALFVPETISVNDLMHQLRGRHTHMAIVLDEFGGTSGIVTLEDLLEEIVGEVQDSFDVEPPAFQPQQDGSILVDGMVLIEEINERFGLELSDPHYDTIAGYILGKLGRIPKVGDEVDDTEHKLRLLVEKMDNLRIAQVRLVHS